MAQPLSQEQFQKLRNGGFTTEKIVEFEKRRLSEGGVSTTQQPTQAKPTITALPRYAETEEEIASRRSPYEVFAEEMNYRPQGFHPLATLMRPLAIAQKGLAIPLRVGEGVVADVGLAAQRGEPMFGDTSLPLGNFPFINPRITQDITQTLQGKRMAELGDIPLAAGVPKPISATIGLLAMAGLLKPSLITQGAKKLTTPIATAGEISKEVGQIGKTIATPFTYVKNKLFPPELKQVRKELGEIQKQFGIDTKKYKPEYIKTKLSEFKKEKGIVIKNKVDEVKLETIKTIDSLKAEQKLFDEKILDKSTDFAKFIKNEAPKWVRSGTEKYGQLIDDIGDIVGKGQKLTSQNIVDFLDDAILNIQNKGLSGRAVNELSVLRADYATQYPTNIIEFGLFKSQMAKVYRYISPQLKNGIGLTSDDAIVSMTKSKWLDFLGNIMPETEKTKFLTLQSKYREFAQAKNAMGQMFHPYSGQYDMSKGMNTAIQFAEQKKAEGINNLMKTLETGIDDYIPGIKDIKLKTQILRELGSQKQAIKETVPVIKKSQFISEKQLNDEKTKYVDEIFQWEKKTTDLLAKKSYIEEQRNNLLKTLRTLGWIGAGVTGIGVGGGLLRKRY